MTEDTQQEKPQEPEAAPAEPPSEPNNTEETSSEEKNEGVEAPVQNVLGIDFGTETAVVTLASTKTLKPDILRNDISNQSTPVILSFQDSERAFGDMAAQGATTNKDNTLSGILRAIGTKAEDFQANTPYCTANVEDGDDSLVFNVKYKGETLQLAPEQVVASFLGKFFGFAKTEERTAVSVVIPDNFTDKQRSLFRTACDIAGIEAVQLVNRSAAVAMTYGTKKSEETIGDSCVMYADVGHGYVTVSVYQWKGKMATKLAAKTVSNLGSAIINERIFDELNVECEKKYGQKVGKKSKGAIRLRKVCQKLKETLSGVPEAAATCENLIDGQDIRFTYTRERLEEACKDEIEQMNKIVKEVYDSLEEGVELTACELVGGGFRVPWVKKAISEAINEAVPFSYTLDPMASTSTGAVFAAARLFEPTGGIRRPAFDNLASIVDNDGIFLTKDIPLSMSEEALASAKELEQSFRENDREIVEFKEAFNKLEAFILATRSKANGGGKFTEMINKDDCLPILDKAEEWLYDEEGGGKDGATKADFVAKYESLKEELEPSCGAYLRAVEEDRVKMEKELEAEAARAAAELEASGGKDDHDFRKLSKPDRMKKVIMNKDEGTSLFKDGNHEAASLRYKRSLQHCDKFFDLSEDDKQEVEKIKLSLHLNISMCHIKMESWDFAMKSCEEALQIESNSTKALYRRAMVLEKKKDFDEAKKDLLKAQKLDPDDKSIIRLMQRVDIQIKRQKAKQKKMAQAMFG